MEIKNLVTFQEVAHTLSFSRAAEALNYSQSAVTMQIKALEEELGAPLFDRVGKRILLTNMGERLLTYAEQLTDLEAEARMMLSNTAEEPEGTLAIDAADSIVSFLLPRIVRSYRKRYPLVELTIKPDHRANPAQGVQVGNVDIAIVFSLPVVSDIHFEPVMIAPCSLVAAPDHPLADKSVITPDDLEDEEVFFTIPECSYYEAFDSKLARFQTSNAANFELRTSQAIKQWVMMGMGVTLLSDFSFAREFEHGDLVRLNWQETNLAIPIMLAWHPEKWLSPAAQAFRQLVHELLAEEDYLEPVSGEMIGN